MGPGKSLEAYTQEELEEILDEFATDEEVENLLKGYVTSDALEDTLGGYVTSGSLSSALGDYVTSEALNSTLEDYATEEYVTGALESYVTSDALGSTLESYVTSSALSDALENYVVSSVYEEESESLSGSLSTLQSSFSALENTVEGISAEVGSLSAEISSVYVNLIDYEDLTDGTQVISTGLSSSTVRTISGYLPVTAGESYTLLANADTDTIYTAVGWFDSEKNFLSAEIWKSTAWTEDQKEELAAPEDAAYAVVCWTTEFTGYMEFWGYTTVSTAVSTCLANLNVTAYGLSSRVAAVEETAVTEDDLTSAVSSEVSSQVEQLADSITAEVRESLTSTTYQYVNLVDYDEVEGGYLESDGSMGENSGWTITDYMPVTGGDAYTVVLNSAVAGKIYAAWYDSDKSYLYTTAVSTDSEEKAAGYEAEVTAPDDAAYARADWGTEDRDALGFWGWVSDTETVRMYESGLCMTAYGISSRVTAMEESAVTEDDLTEAVVSEVSSQVEQLADSITAEVRESLTSTTYQYVNLVDYDEVEGGYLESDGSMGENSGWTITDYMPVTGGDTYTVVLNSAVAGKIYAAWYDSDKSYLYTTAVSTDTEEKAAGYEAEVTAPDDAAYARADWGTEDRDALGFWGWVSDTDTVRMYESGLCMTAYGISSRVTAMEESAVTEDDLTEAVVSEVSSQVEQLADSITATVKEELAETPYEYVNLIDYEEVETGYHIDTDGGKEEEEGWSVSGYTPVEAGETYTAVMNTEMTGNVLAYWYDADQGFLSRTWVSTGTKTAGYEKDVEAPDDAAWVRLAWGMEDADALGLWCWTTDADLIESHESSVSITAYGISSRVEAIEGDYATSSEITQLADSISSRVEAIEEDYATSSEITQLADSITLSVSNSTDTAKITLKAGDDNTQTATISMSGLVTFSDLETEGETTINGANIETGTLSADSIMGGSLQAGSIQLYDSFTVYSSDDTETSLGTLGAMKGQAYNDDGELEDTYGIAIADGTGKSYIIVTGRGARFTCGDEENSYGFYITDTGHFEVTCEGFYVNNEKITFD